MFVIVKPGPKKYSWTYLGCALERLGHENELIDGALFVPVTPEEYANHLDHNSRMIEENMLTARPGETPFFTRRRPINILPDKILEEASDASDVIVILEKNTVRIHISSNTVLDDPQFEISVYGVTRSDPLEPLFSLKTQEQDHTEKFNPTTDEIDVWIVSPVEGVNYGVRNVPEVA